MISRSPFLMVRVIHTLYSWTRFSLSSVQACPTPGQSISTPAQPITSSPMQPVNAGLRSLRSASSTLTRSVNKKTSEARNARSVGLSVVAKLYLPKYSEYRHRIRLILLDCDAAIVPLRIWVAGHVAITRVKRPRTERRRRVVDLLPIQRTAKRLMHTYPQLLPCPPQSFHHCVLDAWAEALQFAIVVQSDLCVVGGRLAQRHPAIEANGLRCIVLIICHYIYYPAFKVFESGKDGSRNAA